MTAELTPEQLATLAVKMGYEVALDETGGYDVKRVLTFKPCAGNTVVRPQSDSEQGWEVLCWLMNTDPLAHWELSTDGNETGDNLRRAVVTAACRVAEDAK
jgi:hypothetical protein